MNEYTAVNDGFGPVARSYDPNGNLTGDGLYAYEYDAFNRLAKVDLNPGWAYYAYDHKGRRVSKQFDWDENGSIDETVNYFYVGNRLIEEQDGSGNTLRQSVWGGGSLLQVKQDVSGVAKTSYVYENGYGSILATTSDGTSPAITRRMDYDACGGTSTVYEKPGEAQVEFFHRGLFHDEETGLYSISNGGYYNPALGSYLSRVLASPAVSRYAIAVPFGGMRFSPKAVPPCVPVRGVGAAEVPFGPGTGDRTTDPDTGLVSGAHVTSGQARNKAGLSAKRLAREDARARCPEHCEFSGLPIGGRWELDVDPAFRLEPWRDEDGNVTFQDYQAWRCDAMALFPCWKKGSRRPNYDAYYDERQLDEELDWGDVGDIVVITVLAHAVGKALGTGGKAGAGIGGKAGAGIGVGGSPAPGLGLPGPAPVLGPNRGGDPFGSYGGGGGGGGELVRRRDHPH